MRNTILMDLYLGEELGWVDGSSDVRQAMADSGGGITITRTDRDAGTMDLVLANPGGIYSPRNPRSAYYGLLGRNTPIRCGVLAFEQQFPDPVPEGWGDGWVWVLGGGGTDTPTDTSVPAPGGVARHQVPVASAFRATIYNARPLVDAEVRIQVAFDGGDITGGGIEPANIMLRVQDVLTYYMARVEISPAEVVSVSLHHTVGGLIAGPVTVPMTWAGQPLEVAASAVGDRLALKVWDASGPEPRDWQVTAVDTQLAEAGPIGVRSGVASGNSNTKPFRFHYSNLRVIDRRAHMEVSEWPPRWTIGGHDVWVPIHAEGLIRRLRQGHSAAHSALRRTVHASQPLGYWPLEDGTDTSQGASALTGGQPLTISGPVPEFREIEHWNDDYPVRYGSAALADIAAGTKLSAPLNGAGAAAGWTVAVAADVRSTAALSADLVLLDVSTPGGTYDRWRLVITTTNRTRIIAFTGGAPTTLVDDPSIISSMVPHNMSVWQDGGNIRCGFRWDSVSGYKATGVVAGTLAGPAGVTVNSTETTSSVPLLVGHVAVWSGHALDVVDLRDGAMILALFSWAWTGLPSGNPTGESAADRIERLCAEQGVTVFVTRGPDASTAMGPQRPGAFLDLIQECADADGGILGEAREQLALTYRCRGALYNQTPVTVPYTMLAPALEPVDDDADLANDVEVRRVDGSSARRVIQEGPLSVLPPPDGVGPYDTSATVNVVADSQLPDIAAWLAHIGTWDEARYPAARVELAAPAWAADPDLAAAVTALDIGRVMALDELPEWLPPGPSEQRVRGSVEQIHQPTRLLEWTLKPAGPWRVAEADGDARVAANGSTLAADLSEAGMSLLLASTVVNGPWTTDVADSPLDVRVGGERVTASTIGNGISDLLDGTIAGGWGTAATGQPWLLDGTAADFSVSGGFGRHSLPANDVTRVSYIGVDIDQFDITFPVRVTALATGAQLVPEMVARWSSLSDHYRFECGLQTSGSVDLRIARVLSGARTVLGSAGGVTTYAASVSVWVRCQGDGSTLRMAAWPQSGTWSGVWDVEVTDSTHASGAVGVLSLAAGGNTNTKPVQILYGEFMAIIPQLVTLSARGANGIQRAWPAGTPVDVWQPAVIAL